MITVYYTWIPDNLDPAREEHWLRELPAGKREAIRRMRLAGGRAASLLGLRLLKLGMLALKQDGFDLKSVCFPPGDKPYCDLPVDFNISHSGEMVACALSTGAKIGIDIEQLRDLRIEAWQRFLNARERAWVGDDQRRFFELWTQKEAVVKGHGKGGIASLRTTAIDQGQGVIEDRTWWLRELNIHPGYVAHVAIESKEPPGPIGVEHLVFLAGGPEN